MLWMIAAMAGFAIEDACVKAAALSLPTAQVLVMFGLGGAAIFAGLAHRAGASLISADALSPVMRLRAVFEVLGRLFWVLAISLIPLSTATMILQATPLVVMAGAAVFFGETVGLRRWLAVAVGLAGVGLIIQPGADGFSALSVLAVLGMLGFAGRDLASRAAPATLNTTVLGVYGFLAIALAGGLYVPFERAAFVWPQGLTWAYVLGTILMGAGAYTCLMKAMRTGEVASVAPFRYSRLLFGVMLGVVFFGEDLGGTVLMGSALIVASGLFIMWRGQQDTAA
ncbi:MAG: DMT family transporter [Marinibacterium sp.]|nr:DMT family transporter [Marinibacterium sp.]